MDEETEEQRARRLAALMPPTRDPDALRACIASILVQLDGLAQRVKRMDASEAAMQVRYRQLTDQYKASLDARVQPLIEAANRWHFARQFLVRVRELGILARGAYLEYEIDKAMAEQRRPAVTMPDSGTEH